MAKKFSKKFTGFREHFYASNNGKARAQNKNGNPKGGNGELYVARREQPAIQAGQKENAHPAQGEQCREQQSAIECDRVKEQHGVVPEWMAVYLCVIQ